MLKTWKMIQVQAGELVSEMRVWLDGFQNVFAISSAPFHSHRRRLGSATLV